MMEGDVKLNKNKKAKSVRPRDNDKGSLCVCLVSCLSFSASSLSPVLQSIVFYGSMLLSLLLRLHLRLCLSFRVRSASKREMGRERERKGKRKGKKDGKERKRREKDMSMSRRPLRISTGVHQHIILAVDTSSKAYRHRHMQTNADRRKRSREGQKTEEGRSLRQLAVLVQHVLPTAGVSTINRDNKVPSESPGGAEKKRERKKQRER